MASVSLPSDLRSLLSKLIFIGMFREDIKVNIHNMSFIDSKSWWGTIFRSYYKEGREVTFEYIEQSIDLTIASITRYSNTEFLPIIVNALNRARTGIINFEKTYKKDPKTTSQVQVLIGSIDLQLSKFPLLIKEDNDVSFNETVRSVISSNTLSSSPSTSSGLLGSSSPLVPSTSTTFIPSSSPPSSGISLNGLSSSSSNPTSVQTNVTPSNNLNHQGTQNAQANQGVYNTSSSLIQQPQQPQQPQQQFPSDEESVTPEPISFSGNGRDSSPSIPIPYSTDRIVDSLTGLNVENEDELSKGPNRRTSRKLRKK